MAHAVEERGVEAESLGTGAHVGTLRAIKRINHNAAICEDGAGHQLIALGRGIGFGELPRDIALSEVTRTFYGIDRKYLAFIEEVDPKVLEFAAQFSEIVTQQVSYELSPNLPITLADHIQFSLKRAREHMVVSMPLTEDVQQQHPLEYKLGELAVRGMAKTFNVRLPRQEAGAIALSIVNAMARPSTRRLRASRDDEELLERIAVLAERGMGASIDRESFAYARFATHIRYLLKRVASDEAIATENAGAYELMAQQSPDAARVASSIDAAIQSVWNKPLSREELLYLIMHLNRIAPPSGGFIEA